MSSKLHNGFVAALGTLALTLGGSGTIVVAIFGFIGCQNAGRQAADDGVFATKRTPLILATGTDVGTLSGDLSTTPGGQATYTVGLWTPAHRNEALTPQLALAYSSAGTDSPSGYGWAIVGGQVSTIRRCVESSRRSDRPVAIQFLATDPLCLDGRRLVLIAGVAGKKGAEYRTEPESFTKVTIDGDDALGPTEFSVFSMSGLIHSYGSATDPSLTIEGPRQKWTVPFPAKVLGTRSDADIVKETATARLGWLRGSTRDRFSQPNMVWFKYLHPADARTTDGQQEPLLDAIEYVDMGTIRTRTIKFNYVSRNPLSERFGYFAGLSIKSTKLLQSIDIRVAEAGATSPSSVRFYDFTYTTSEWSQRPLLKEVMECDGNPLTVTARAVSCKLPTVFSYESGSFNFRDIPTSISDLRQADDKPFWSISVADINRDGLDDIVYRARPPGADVSAPPHWFYRLSTGEGLGDPVDMLLEENTVPGDPVLIDFALNDGRPDIAVPRSDSSYAYYINTTSGFVLATVPGGEGVTQSLQIGDFGNKGQMVILRPLTGGRWGYRLLAGSAENATMSALSGDLGTASWLENPLQAGWSTYVADIDGDTAPDFLTPTIGAPDYLAATIQLKVPAPMPVEGSNPPIDPPDWGLADTTLLASKAGDQVKYLVFDHNGDGNADVLRLRQSAGEAPALILNTANGFNAPATIGLGGAAFIRLGPGTVPKDLSDVGARILDFDGDGRDDILLVDDGVTRDSSNPGAPTRSNLTVMLSRPGGFEERNLGIPIGAPADGPAPPNSSAVRNFKQTVLIDLNGDGLRDIVQVNASDFKLHIFVREGERPDLLVGVKDGMGRRASINYRPMTDPTVYTVGTGCVSPQLCVTSASRVVSSYFLDNGTGLNEFRCKYEDGRYDLEGAGFLGFSKWSLTDLATSTTVTETYNLFVREKVPSFNGIDPSATVYGYIGLPVTRAVETVAPGFVRKQAATIKYEFIRTYNGVSYYSRPTSTNSTDDETRGMVTTRLLTQTQTPQYDPTLSNFGLTSGSTVVTSTEAGDVTDSWASTYDNFPERWLLGLEKELTVTSKTATEQTSRKTLSHPDPITGVLNSTEIEPTAGTSDQYLLVELGRSPRGQVTSVKRTDRLGNARVEGVGYDLQEVHPRTLTNALGHVTTVDTDAALGMPTVVTDPNNIKTTFDHDAFGRRRRISLPGGGGQSTTYVRQLEAGSASSDGRFVMKATTKFDGGGETLTIINRLGQQIRQEAKNLDGSSSFVSQAYNNLGLLDSATRPAKVGNAPGASTLWKYDPLGRVILRTRPEDGRDRAGVPVTEAAMSRSYEGLVATFNDEFERQTKVTSDPLGRVTKSEARNDAGQWLPTKFTYWPFSLLRAVSRNNGVGSDSRTTEAVYDILGRQTQISDPDTGTRTTKYNAFGEVREETDAVGAVSTYIPDNEGRVSEKHDKDGTTKFIWDTATNGKGKIAETQSASGVRRQFFYDGAGRMNREIWTMAGSTFQVDYTFDSSGRVQKVSYPNVNGFGRFAVKNSYDPDSGQLSRVQNDSSGLSYWQLKTTEVDGQIRQEVLGNKVVTDYDHSSVTGRLSAIKSTLPGASSTTLRSWNYGYWSDGNLQRRSDVRANQHERFEYDSLNRLKSWMAAGAEGMPASGGWSVNYTIDDFGNLSRRQFVAGATTGGTSQDVAMTYFPGTNRVKTSPWGNYSYDGNGNQTSRAGGDNVDYTAFDLPKTISGAHSAVFLYDAFGTRAKKRKSETDYTFYVAGIYEKRVSGSTADHIFYVIGGGGVVAQVNRREGGGESTQYVHADHLGSIDAVTDAAGAVLERTKRDPYGNRVTNFNQPTLPTTGTRTPGSVRIGFTGQDQDDEFGLINMQGRVYDPRLGGFLTPDPVVQSLMDGQSHNRYAYVRNNPLRFVDPSGYLRAERALPEGWGEFGGWGGKDPYAGQPGRGGRPSARPRQLEPWTISSTYTTTEDQWIRGDDGQDYFVPKGTEGVEIRPAMAQPVDMSGPAATPERDMGRPTTASNEKEQPQMQPKPPVKKAECCGCGCASGGGVFQGSNHEDARAALRHGLLMDDLSQFASDLGDAFLNVIPGHRMMGNANGYFDRGQYGWGALLAAGAVFDAGLAAFTGGGGLATRGITAADVGLSRATLRSLEGTVTNAGTTRILRVENIAGNIPAGEIRGALQRIVEQAGAGGVKTLQIEGRFANEALQRFVTGQTERLGGSVSSSCGIDTLTFILGR